LDDRPNPSGDLLHQVERLNWTLAAIGKVTGVLMRAQSEDELYAGICEAIVYQMAFDLAWIGQPRQDAEKSILIRARAGRASGYLELLKLSWDPDSPYGNGPTGRAVRSGQIQFNNHMLDSLTFEPWRRQAREYGLFSSFCLPIRLPNGEMVATLVVYSNKAEAFGAEELALFTQLGEDLGIGIDALRAKSAVKQERLFSEAMMESTPGIIYSFDAEGRYLRWNRNLQTISGYSAEEIATMHPLQFFAPEDHARIKAAIEKVIASDPTVVEADLVVKNGDRIPHLFTGHRMELDGQAYLVGVGLDISDRKAQERDLADYASRLQSASRQLLQVQETERRGLSRELHDQVGQEMAALNLNLTILRSLLPADLSETVLSTLDDSQSVLEEASRHLRNVMMELRPPGLDELGLLPALQDHGQRVARRAGLDLAITGAEPEPRLPPTAEIALFRIVQEALNNIVKHAEAKHAGIELVTGNDAVTLTVSDDGKGFDPRQRRYQTGSGGMGTTTMRERAEAIGARYSLSSAPGIGTRITVEIPRR